MVKVPTFKAEVRGRRGLIFSGELAAITSYNDVGQFDILPKHINFVSMLKKKLILRRVDGRVEEVEINNGVVMVEDNRARVFAGVGKV